jgi:sugar phosphate permease
LAPIAEEDGQAPDEYSNMRQEGEMETGRNTEAAGMSARDQGAPWFMQLGQQGRRTLTAAFAGWVIDAFDFMVFSFVITTLMEQLHLSKSDIGVIGTATLLASAVGGWIAGMLADRFGRTAILQATIVWFSVFTVAIGFAQKWL